MQHFVLTRFNQEAPNNWKSNFIIPQEFSPNIWLDEKWLNARFQYFEAFCLPSIKYQTINEFTWVLGICKDTPQYAIHKLEDLVSNCKCKTVITKESFDQIIRKSHNGLHNITTRLDNDDAISSDFVEILQNNFKPKKILYFMNLPFGYFWYRHRCRPRYHRSNMFISMVLRGKRTVFLEEHPEIIKKYAVYQIDGKPSWIYVKHDYTTMGYMTTHIDIDMRQKIKPYLLEEKILMESERFFLDLNRIDQFSS